MTQLTKHEIGVVWGGYYSLSKALEGIIRLAEFRHLTEVSHEKMNDAILYTLKEDDINWSYFNLAHKWIDAVLYATAATANIIVLARYCYARLGHRHNA